MVCFSFSHQGEGEGKFQNLWSRLLSYFEDGLMLGLKWVPLVRGESCIKIIKRTFDQPTA